MSDALRAKWLIEEGWEEIDPVWQDRILVILEDLVSLEHLRGCRVFDQAGKPLSHLLGVGGDRLTAETQFPLKDHTSLITAVERTFGMLGEEMPEYLVEQRTDGYLFMGFAAGMILVVWFSSECEEGAVAMRFSKRVRHLRSLQRTRNRSALYT